MSEYPSPPLDEVEAHANQRISGEHVAVYYWKRKRTSKVRFYTFSLFLFFLLFRIYRNSGNIMIVVQIVQLFVVVYVYAGHVTYAKQQIYICI